MSDDNSDEPSLATDSLHAGQEPDPATGSRAPPIHQTTSYVFDDAEDAAAQFELSKPGYIYTRLMNPTVETLQERLAALEGGVGAAVTASGMAAFDLTTFLLASADAIDEDTAYVHLETIGNPALDTPDIQRVADIAHEHGTPLFVDNTFATPALCRPLEHGADLVWDSTTKWLHGSGTTVGGVVVDGGSFPWSEYAEDYPEIAADNPAYHGVNFAETFGEQAFTYAAIARGLRDLGNQQSPFDAWQTIQGLETLPLRMDRHCENAMAVAEFLDQHEDVAWVNYPGLESHPTHDTASEYLDGGYGGMITFGLEGGYEAARGTVESTELASLLANVGDAKTLSIHPASTTHQQLTEEEKESSGVTDDLVRLSVGIEDPGRIIDDLRQAIEASS